jgi:hypothetical protein
MTSIIPQTEDQSDPVDPLLATFMDKVHDVSTDGGRPQAEVTVKRSGKWFVLKGWVSSHRIKSKLISRVPTVHGAQYIIDRVQVRSN